MHLKYGLCGANGLWVFASSASNYESYTSIVHELHNFHVLYSFHYTPVDILHLVSFIFLSIYLSSVYSIWKSSSVGSLAADDSLSFGGFLLFVSLVQGNM